MAVYVIVSASTARESLTEAETLDAIAGAIGERPDDLAEFSVPLIGEWDGQREHSRAIEVGHPRDTVAWRNVHALAYRLREELRQEAVMILATRESDLTEENMGRVFENVERVSIALPGREEVARENLGTSTQTDGEPIIPGVRNGSRWATVADVYGTHVQAFV